MGGTGLKEFVLANPTWMSSEMIARLHNALWGVIYTNECLLNCWKTASEIVCKKYNIETIYDIREGVDEAEYWTCILVKMCANEEVCSE